MSNSTVAPKLSATHSALTHSPNVEQALLAAILMDQGQLHEVSALLEPNDFVEPLFQDIYKAMVDLFEQRQSVDFVSLGDKLADNAPLQKLGGSIFLAEMMQNIPSSSIAPHYAGLVKEKSQRRKLSKLGATIINLSVDDEQDSQSMMAFAEKELRELSAQSSGSSLVRLNEVCDERFESYSEAFESDDPERFAGIKTGFFALDSLLGGFQPGQMMVLAARPGMGKTALAMNIARNVASDNQKVVGVFSLEMATEEIANRFVSGQLGVDSRNLSRGTITEAQFNKLGGVMDRLGELPIFLDDHSTRISEIASNARQLQMREGLDLLIVDYLQLLSPPRKASENRVQQITEMSRQLKLLGRELDCPIIVLSQLNRECEKRTPPVPFMADLRESGAIEQDADSIVMLYREGHYDPDCERPTLTDVLVRKNRHGPIGRFELDFDSERIQFNSVETFRDSQPELPQ